MAAARPAHVTLVCRVSVFAESFLYFAECFMFGTRQSLLLPSAICLPSVLLNTHGKCCVCRVSDEIHSAMNMALGKSFDSGSECSFHQHGVQSTTSTPRASSLG